MQNRKDNMEETLKNAVAHLTPDVLDNILLKCDARDDTVFVIQPRRPKNNRLRAAGAIAAAFVLAFTGLFTYGGIERIRPAALVMLDVNPSIELEVNKHDRVINTRAKNEDAVKIMDNMDLKDTQINVAINALIGSMLKYGYIRENANSVLLSVESNSEEKVVLLQKNLTESISQQLSVVNGAVIGQQLDADNETRRLADEHQISYGKAALVQKILAENSHMLFSDLSRLSVNELNLLVGSKHIQAAGMESQGSASDTDFIGDDAARRIALEHAGISESEAELKTVELDYDDGKMVYEIEFIHNNREYEYEIDAKDGAVVEFDREREKEHVTQNQTAAQPQADFIGEDRVVEIVENHSGVTDHTKMKIKREKDDGLYIYEVDFKSGGHEYDYEINAYTGDIVSWESEEDD